jgi:hypothetical protein
VTAPSAPADAVSPATGSSGSSRPLTPRRVVATALRLVRSEPRRSLGETVRAQHRAYERATVLVQAFYAVSLAWLVIDMGRWPDLLDSDVARPLWPAGWLSRSDPRGGLTVIVALYAAGAMSAAAFPRVRLFRLLYAFGLLEYMAVVNGYGKINHNFHGWLWVAGLLVLLPGHRARRGTTAERQTTLAVLWSCQVVVLFFYALTGLWKFAYAVHALVSERVSAFELDGFSLLVAGRLLETNQKTLLGDWLVRNSLPGWILFNGTMYLETFGLVVAFRPRVHRLWGLGLITFHLGTQVAMGFSFEQNIVLVGLLLVCSPWAPETVTAREVVADLPLVRFALARISGRRRRRSPP